MILSESITKAQQIKGFDLLNISPHNPPKQNTVKKENFARVHTYIYVTETKVLLI